MNNLGNNVYQKTRKERESRNTRKTKETLNLVSWLTLLISIPLF